MINPTDRAALYSYTEKLCGCGTKLACCRDSSKMTSLRAAVLSISRVTASRRNASGERPDKAATLES
jgi:hypothetical protein